jgi:hypothetical protein
MMHLKKELYLSARVFIGVYANVMKCKMTNMKRHIIKKRYVRKESMNGQEKMN